MTNEIVHGGSCLLAPLDCGMSSGKRGDTALLHRLKIETSPAHERIEKAVNLQESLTTVNAYRALLIRFYGFVASWEPRAEAAIGDSGFFAPRRKVRLLARDLMALGLSGQEIDRLPQCEQLAPMATLADAYGAMYVMEGSTLGGSVIARLVERRLGIRPDNGCCYFRCYGRNVRPMWRAFRLRLLSVSSPTNDELIIASANRTFFTLQRWLSGCQQVPARYQL